MSKNKDKVNLKDVAMEEMQEFVESHNQLIQQISEANSKLADLKSAIIEKQGYLKGLEDCDEQCGKEK
jgi:prefoldin subunit 5